jgi:hypothetical protein
VFGRGEQLCQRNDYPKLRITQRRSEIGDQKKRAGQFSVVVC